MRSNCSRGITGSAVTKGELVQGCKERPVHVVMSELALEVTGGTEKHQYCSTKEEAEADIFCDTIFISQALGTGKEGIMKAGFLLSGIGSYSPNLEELMLRNALHEIDRLEAVQADLQKQVDYYEGIFQQARKFARCDRFSHGPFISIGNIYEDDITALFADLMDLLQLEEPEEKEETNE